MWSELTRIATETAREARPGTVRSFYRWFSCIRFDEVIALQATPVIGGLFATGQATTSHIPTLALLIAGNICLVSHVFLLNDWSGIDGDLNDPSRIARTFAAKGVSRREIGYFAVASLAVGLCLFGLISVVTLLIAAAIAVLGILYSGPTFHLKGAPLLNSILHFLGGSLHFLLGYAAFGGFDARAILLSCFFGLVFTAGHFTHETRDRDIDRVNGIRTNAVAFGKTPCFVSGLVLFLLAYALLALLAVLRLVPFVFVFTAALIPAHLSASLEALQRGLSSESLRWLQRFYRALFAFIGLAMVVVAIRP